MRHALAAFVWLSCVACGADAPVPDAGLPRPPEVALCYVQGQGESSAATGFLTALLAGDREARAQNIADLEASVEATPGDERDHLFLGLAYLWRLAEPRPDEMDLGTQANSAVGARDHLERAYQICPTDHRIAAWLGPVLVRFGRAVADQGMVDRGLAVLDQGIAHYASFVLFSRLLVFADFARESPEFQQALDAVAANIDACAATPADPACNNRTVPHNMEGGGLFLGDAMAKGGRRDLAMAAYAAVADGADFAAWSYGSEITERLGDLDGRIARFTNSDPADDPPVAWTAERQCGFCHQL